MKNTGFLWSLLFAGLLLFACSERDDTQPDDDDTSEADPCDNCFPEGEVVPACTETSQCTGWIYGNSLCGPDGFCELGVPECWECEDDPADDDDDFDWEDPPIFLASYDFSLVMLDNQITQSFSVIFGQMDISVSSTAFLAEMVTETGETWDWGGSLDSNAQQFLVGGTEFLPGIILRPKVIGRMTHLQQRG